MRKINLNSMLFMLCKGDDYFMLKQLAWNTFKNTGNIDTFMEFVEVQNIEKIEERDVNNIEYGNNQNKGTSNFRK